MGVKNKVFVFLGNIRFDGPIKSTSLFLARQLAKTNKVYFVDYPLTLKDAIRDRSTRAFKRTTAKIGSSSGSLIPTDLPNLKIITPPLVLPINFLPEGFLFRSALKFNELLIGRRLKRVLRQEQVTEFIYINAFNFHYPGIAQLIKPKLTVYYCMDPMIIPYDRKHGIISENFLVKKSDLVICTSKALCDEKISQNKATYYIPNAADVEHSAKALDPNLPVLPGLKELPSPVIGYLGTIERRMDYSLLMQVVNANPGKTFVFAGPLWGNHVPAQLQQAPNVHFIGPVNYEETPQIIKKFDVAIIPFKKDEVSHTIYPLKLFEYLGAGKPVVSTDFNPDLRGQTNDVIAYCSNAAEFTAALNAELQSDSETKVNQRLAIAQQNTWEKRADEIGNIIESHLNQSKARNLQIAI